MNRCGVVCAVWVPHSPAMLSLTGATAGFVAVIGSKYIETITVLGMAAKQVFAIGALAVDIVAYGIMPLYHVEMQGIEVDTPADGHVSNPFGTFGSNSSVTKSIALSM